MISNEELAVKIIDLIGKDNFLSIDNCATRIRLELKSIDEALVLNLNKLVGQGVTGVVKTSAKSLQIIIGSKVQDVTDEIKKLLGYSLTANAQEALNHSNSELAAKIIDLIGKDNFTSIDNCATRIRLELKSIDDALVLALNRLVGQGVVGAVKTSDKSLQIIIGPKVQAVTDEIKKILAC